MAEYELVVAGWQPINIPLPAEFPNEPSGGKCIDCEYEGIPECRRCQRTKLPGAWGDAMWVGRAA
jgi:hypothetical protein